MHVAAGDTDGDGKAEVIAGGVNVPVVGVFDGVTGAVRSAFWAFPMGRGGATVAAGDIDGDGQAGIFTGTTGVGVPAIGVYRPDGSLVGSAMSFGPSAVPVGARVGAGDRDGDGRAELMVGTGPVAPAVMMAMGPTTLDPLLALLPLSPASSAASGADKQRSGGSALPPDDHRPARGHVSPLAALSWV